MREEWSYDRKRWIDRKAGRWHIAEFWRWNSEAEHWYEERAGERSYDLYFRNEDRTIYGVIRFPRSRDNPYGFDKLKEKIMNDVEFRKEYIDQSTKRVWKKGWK